MRVLVAVSAAAILGVSALTGCGADAPTPSLGASADARCAARAARVNVADGHGAATAPDDVKDVFISATDVSASTADARLSYLPDMVVFAQRAARDRGLYYADAFGGRPRATTTYPVQADFATEPAGFGGNETLASASRDCDAASLAGPLGSLLRRTPGHPGSPLLEMLAVTGELAAEHDGATPYVALFTDGELVEDDFDVRTEQLTDERLAELVAAWRDRMQGLAGAHVYVVGVGRGSGLTQEQLDDVHRLLSAVLATVGARVEAFDARFAQGFAGSAI